MVMALWCGGAVGDDFSGLMVRPEVYRSLAVDDYGSPRSLLNLGDLTLDSRQQQQSRHGALDAFDSFSQPSKELSLDPKHGQRGIQQTQYMDYAVAPSAAPAAASSMSSSSSASSSSVPAEAGPGAPPGGYLEPSTHFFVNSSSPCAVLDALLGVLKAAGVDCQLHPECFKMKCEAYRDCARVEFCVRLFSVRDQGADFAVEFQRRFGDGMVFHNLYNEIRKTFIELHQLDAPVAPTPRAAASTASSSWSSSTDQATQSGEGEIVLSPLRCPPLDIPEMRCCKQVQCDVLSYLLQMCRSDCVDVKANAITALAEMSSKCEMKEAMLQSGCVDIFLQSLSCSYQDVHRCALTGLANLIRCCRNTGACQQWMAKEKVAHALCKLITSGCPQIVREAARSMEFIASTLKDQVRDDGCIRYCLDQLACSQDVQARQSAQKIEETLQLVQ